MPTASASRLRCPASLLAVFIGLPLGASMPPPPGSGSTWLGPPPATCLHQHRRRASLATRSQALAAAPATPSPVPATPSLGPPTASLLGLQAAQLLQRWQTPCSRALCLSRRRQRPSRPLPWSSRPSSRLRWAESAHPPLCTCTTLYTPLYRTLPAHHQGVSSCLPPFTAAASLRLAGFVCDASTPHRTVDTLHLPRPATSMAQTSAVPSPHPSFSRTCPEHSPFSYRPLQDALGSAPPSPR